MKFTQLTKAQQAEIKMEYKGWPEKDLMRATWTQSPEHLIKQGFGKWCADFNTKVKI